MSLELDERQRAMLQEMGVRVFAPPADSGAGAAPEQATAAAPARAAQGSTEQRPARLEAPPTLRPPQPASAPQRIPAVTEAPLRQQAGGVAAMDWDALAQAVAGCRACGLCDGRSAPVFGVGDLQPDWMVIGEFPGEEEASRGEPFLGEHGRLLDNMLAAVGARRGKGLYIANLLKARPPGNRNPQPEEIAQCEPFLRRQVELLRPKVIVAMGRFAVQTLLQTTDPIGKLRGRVHRYHDVPLVVTFHPGYLLRNLPDKAKAWADLCLAQEVMRGRA